MLISVIKKLNLVLFNLVYIHLINYGYKRRWLKQVLPCCVDNGEQTAPEDECKVGATRECTSTEH